MPCRLFLLQENSVNMSKSDMEQDKELVKKEILRSVLITAAQSPDTSSDEAGKMAERLRGFAAYRQARRVFISPAAILSQMRVNALLDGKELIMPGPGLKEGFFFYRPHTIPVKNLAYAVSYRGLAKFGKRMEMEALQQAAIDLMLTDAVAIDLNGGRLGHGEGFFDLTVAILATLKALSEQVEIMAAIAERQIYQDGLLPVDPWDVPVDGVITSAGVKTFGSNRSGFPQIFWDKLPRKRIRKITPLWRIYTNEP